jgi:uncharacterized protein (DUF1800 family)
MKSGFNKLALFLLGLSLACAVPQLLAKKKDKAAESGPAEQKRALHALNRLTFGPRPGDIQKVVAMGVDQWIDLQLHPDKIADSDIEARLAPFRTLRMSSREIVEEFPDQQMIRQINDGKKPMPSDPAKRAVVQVQIARMEEKKDRKEQTAAVAPAPAASVPAAENTAKTEEELAAAAAAESGNMSGGNKMSGSADQNSATSMVAGTDGAEAKPSPAEEAEARRREDRLYADLKIQGLADVPPNERYKKVLALPLEEQIVFADSLRGGRGQDLLAGLNPMQRETLQAMNNPQGVIVDELVQAKLLRAVYSERQLDEVMADFWFNHFNVFVNKGADRVLLTNYEQQVIRPHALGKFEDLLLATAHSPAMLFYLDNWVSVGPSSQRALGGPGRGPGPYATGPYRRYPRRFPNPNPNANEKRRPNSGLNENYGRELLELHTLSVNDGYSQKDVTEVAKVFTGWTIDKPFEGGGFRYDPRMHEPGPKYVLGKKIKENGEDEGREVLHRLATSPQTAHFISLKLAQRFVTDDPPTALVDRMAKTFEKKKGDIREVLSTMFHSPEFWAEGTYRAKVKTPLEFVASAVRATGAQIDDALPLTRQLNNMGMPLFGAQPPTGYSTKADTWVSSSALLTRMNFALALTSGKIRGVKVDTAQLAGGRTPLPDATETLSTMETTLLASDVSKQTHDSIMAQIEAGTKAPAPASQDKQVPDEKPADRARPPDASTIAGLLLGSPEFQRR